MVLACFILLIQTSIAHASVNCTDWEVIGRVDQQCDSNDGCGVLWLKDTYKYKETLRKRCTFPTDDGLGVYVESIYDWRWVKDGCCN